MARARVVFVLKSLRERWPDLPSLDERGFERQHARVRRGIDIWIAQGYARLREPLEARGFEVSVSERFVPGAICVAHRDDLNRYRDPLHECFVVGVRADRPEVTVAEIEVVQSAVQVDSSRARFLPSWPQPGLIPRDASRGSCIRRAAYLGRTSAAPAWYFEESFRRKLLDIGITFDVRTGRWNDYSQVDIVLAHRDENEAMLQRKPATKLVNAWLAEAPALVAPEPAIEELRRGDLDFIATADAASTLAAVRSLAREPARYLAMIENGRRRSREYVASAVRGRWMALFENDVMPAYELWRLRGGWERYLRHLHTMSAQKLAARRFRQAERRDRPASPSSIPQSAQKTSELGR